MGVHRGVAFTDNPTYVYKDGATDGPLPWRAEGLSYRSLASGTRLGSCAISSMPVTCHVRFSSRTASSAKFEAALTARVTSRGVQYMYHSPRAHIPRNLPAQTTEL